jgi:polysaccharide pyruvyl transferase WcaK-like protein
LLVHGGGGVFFDFTNHASKYVVLNLLIKLMGFRTYHTLYDAFRKLRGQEFIKQKRRAGFGIGVGTYTSSSNRFFSDILALSTFDILLVRDDASVHNAKQYCRSKNIYKSSDLAFLYDRWMPATIIKPAKPESIAFILRDWAFDNNVSILLSVAKALLSRGHHIKFFAFDEDSDSDFIRSAACVAPVCTWEPTKMTMEEYLSELSTCKLVVSSRAHGAIVSACLGIPVCCVCIEPKLEQIASMLSHSARRINKPFHVNDILNQIESALRNLSILKAATVQDVTTNNLEISQGIGLFRKFITTYPTS